MSREIGYARALQILERFEPVDGALPRSIIEHNGASKPCYTRGMNL